MDSVPPEKAAQFKAIIDKLRAVGMPPEQRLQVFYGVVAELRRTARAKITHKLDQGVAKLGKDVGLDRLNAIIEEASDKVTEKLIARYLPLLMEDPPDLPNAK